MATYLIRIFLFTLFPVLLALLIKFIDRSVKSTPRILELTLILLFGIGVAGAGIFNFFAHFFISDVVARSIGWETGNPFQLEVAFANLAIGALGVVASGRRDGFREATVVAATVFSVGATIVHLLDIVSTGNLAPGNTIQNLGNLLKPALLIWFLRKQRLTVNQAPSREISTQMDQWRAPLVRSTGFLAVAVSTGYGIGFALDQVGLFSIIGMAVSVGIVILVLSRAPDHELLWKSK
jgi:hypothetical protein